MDTVVASIGINLLSSSIYDIAKNLILPEKRETLDQKFIKAIQRTLKKANTEIRAILDSGTFCKYFQSPQFLDVINDYLNYIILRNYESSKELQRKLQSEIITKDKIVDFISDNIYQMYNDNAVLNLPSKSTIREAVEFVLASAESIVMRSISPENTKLLYSFGTHIDDIRTALNILNQGIIGLRAKITKLCELPIFTPSEDYQKTKTKYDSILLNRYQYAHIYLLDKFLFRSFYVPPILKWKVGIDSKTVNWEGIFTGNNIVYIVGGAGYGKTLFTRKIINDYKELDILHSDEYLVIYGELKYFYPRGEELSVSVKTFLKNSIRESTGLDVSDEFIQYYLNAGRCIVLLDALDEVDKSKRAGLHEKIIAYFKTQNPNNKICITSRARGFIPESNVEVLEIAPLEEGQIEKYVDNIIALGKFERSDKDDFIRQTEPLVKTGFLRSFLVLSLLVSIYKAERELPENKLELYQKCFEYIAKKREKDKLNLEELEVPFDWKVIRPVMIENTFIELARMCMPNNSNVGENEIQERLTSIYQTKYSCSADTENAVDEFLRFCSERTELFVPTTEDNYKFFHRSFFEYFYSRYIFLRCKDADEILAEFEKFDVDSEVFELTVAMLKQSDEEKYQSLIELLLKKSKEELTNNQSSISAAFNMLMLSMSVVDDAVYKNDLLKIITENSEKILKDIKKCVDNLGNPYNTYNTYNLNVLESVYRDNREACIKISETYEEPILEGILCELTTENDKSFYIVDRTKWSNYVYMMCIFDSFGFIYSRVHDVQKILREMPDKKVLKILKRVYSPKKYKADFLSAFHRGIEDPPEGIKDLFQAYEGGNP